MKTKKIKIDMLKTSVTIHICKNVKKLTKFYNKYLIEPYAKDESQGLCFNFMEDKDGDVTQVVWVKEFDIPIIAHELYHAVKYILDWFGIEDHETGAYLTEYLLENALEMELE